MENILSYKDVEIRRNAHLALTGVNIRISVGEMVYLLGRVGSGKTSFLKSIYADVPVASGEARVFDYDLGSIKSSQVPFLRRKIGIVFQDFQLLSDRSAYDNLDFVLRATGWNDADERAARIDHVLGLTGMRTKAFKFPHRLSGGEQQRIVIARALLNSPKLILADEPTGNLDPETGEQIMVLLHSLAESGDTSVIMATHNHAYPSRYPGRVLRCERKHMEEER